MLPGYLPAQVVYAIASSRQLTASRRPPSRAPPKSLCSPSWFNRFRKLLVRYEKLERSFVALNHIAAAMIAFRKVKLTVNILYG